MNAFTNLLFAIVLASGGDAPQSAPEIPPHIDGQVCVTVVQASDAGIVYGVETNNRLMKMVSRIA